MDAILLIAHAGLARDYCDVASTILGGEPLPLTCIGAEWGESREAIAEKIADFFKAGGHGKTLVLADLFGSTHVNVCMPYLEPGRVEIITGFNLPMLLKALRLVNTVPFETLVSRLVEYGRHHISSAKEVC